MKLRQNKMAFSLVETVLALGIFAFCILVLIGLMLTGMRAARSVSDETNAVNIANSIFGAWQVQTNKAASLSIDGMVENLPSIIGSVSRQPVLFDAAGRQTSSEAEASLKMFYSVSPAGSGSFSELELLFYWPPQAPTNAAQTRTMSRLISL
jgi:uncharacterized protein (TIGR02598 family)